MMGGSWEEFMKEFMKGPKYHALMDRGKPRKDTKLRSQMVGFTLVFWEQGGKGGDELIAAANVEQAPTESRHGQSISNSSVKF